MKLSALLRGVRKSAATGARAVPGGAVFALAGLGAAPGPRQRGNPSLRSVDMPLLLLIVALLLFGLVMVFSASIALADSPRYKVTPTFFLVRHAVSMTIALAAAALAFALPVASWQRLAPWLFAGAGILLIVVLIPGVGKGALGARRWISLGGLNLQPSEVMKLACVVYAADFTVRKQDFMHDFGKGFAPMAGVMAIVGVLLLLQPDLGAFGVIVSISMAILFLGGVNGRLFTSIAAALVAAFMAVIWASPWRRERIFAYLDPWSQENVLGRGYQLSHSLIAFGRGEWFGVGLGASVEKLHYLPEAHTDFIMSVIGEELGLAGVLVVIVSFYWLVKRAVEIGRQAIALERTFSGLVAQGIGTWMGLQAFINIGVATGLLPTKGLTLPLMSYGGSALMSSLVALAILLRIDCENRILMRGGKTP
ncbi:integral membrane protein involved in stabilizing FstZ ring during cell division [Burkholderiales bacterium]|nr:integral membrane protein involved in stabilizing FstZ ring during cell division [Burkholderiales bacterium]